LALLRTDGVRGLTYSFRAVELNPLRPMKTRLKNPFLLTLLVVGMSCAATARAQTLTTLHSFTGIDGANPVGGVVLSGGQLYGTTEFGGDITNGTVFKVNLDGTGFTNLYKFTGGTDGAGPNGSLVLSSNTLYGMCAVGGTAGNGTVFGLNTDGTGFTVLHSFTNGDGANPYGGLILVSNALYGTTEVGGVGGYGTVFRVNTDGSDFTNLLFFTFDGPYSVARLLSLSNTLYGTTQGLFSGGDPGTDRPGTVFSLTADGGGFTTVQITGHPRAGLILVSNTLYGTTAESYYAGDYGTVFKINTDGAGFSVLHAFTPTTSFPSINSDGADPEARLISSGNTLYGTCANGGSSGNGTIFAINTDGTGFTNLYSFTGGSNGGIPISSLVLFGNTFYGTALEGGSAGNGTVFSLSFPPQLNIVHSSSNIVLSWPTNYAGFDYSGFALQFSIKLISPVWVAVSTTPVIINGQYTVTLPISSSQQFFRLSQ
jgi:uncharacterized repeat protein (TIGR03803 family)